MTTMPAEVDVDRAALHDSLDQLVLALVRSRMDPWAVRDLLEDRPVRDAEGHPIRGLGDARWTCATRPRGVTVWQVHDPRGRLVALLWGSARSPSAWGFDVLPAEGPP